MLRAMVTHRRRRTFLTVFGLYAFAALFIGYFAANAFTGNHGLRAQQDLEQQLTAMRGDLVQLKAERAVWERRGGGLGGARSDATSLGGGGRAPVRACESPGPTFFLQPPSAHGKDGSRLP